MRSRGHTDSEYSNELCLTFATIFSKTMTINCTYDSFSMPFEPFSFRPRAIRSQYFFRFLFNGMFLNVMQVIEPGN